MRNFKHINASTVDEVVTLLTEYKGRAKVSAGGTDLLGTLKDNIHPDYPEIIISLNGIKDLSYIEEDNSGVKIGALTKLYDIEKNRQLKEKYPALTEAAHAVASHHIRHMGTIGGNICQEVRCWYYRHSNNRFYCIRKGGRECNALLGENQYHSIYGGARIDMAPCSKECPANVDIPTYLEMIREENLDAAARKLLEYNPIPAVTGRVCPHFCQEGCGRELFDSNVSIGKIEQFLGDYILDNTRTFFGQPKKGNGKKVAIIGSGPAGISAAYYLRQFGYDVTVFERQKDIGGVLTYGIPPYRLPKNIVKNIVKALEDAGISFRTGVNVGKDVTVEDLMKSNDAVFLACGAWIERKMGIEGEELAISSLDFLSRINSGERKIKGEKVAIVGGGNAAIDVARTLIRLGAKPTVLYRRSEEEMPAIREEVIKAKEEGVRFEFLTIPIKASQKGNYIELECSKTRLGAPDQTGRRRPERIVGSEYTESYDMLIKGIGQMGDISIVPARFLNEQGNLNYEENENQHIGENLFAGGDFVTGPATVVQALAAGRKAAYAIQEFLGTGKEENLIKKESQRYGLFSGVYLRPKKSVSIQELPVVERIKNVEVEDVIGLKIDEVKEEANRCFNCSCLAVSPSDMAPALIALNATIKTTKRSIKAEEFFRAGLETSTVLDSDEIVTEIILPPAKPETKQTYIKFALRKSIDFPIIGVAATITYSEEGKIEDARIAIGGVAPIPLRAKAAEDFLKGKKLEERVAEEAAEIVVKPARALAKNAYKIQVTKSLVKRAILKLQLS